jgi:FemAB-related protein (PEP-CTERM system-associated)
MRNIIIEELSVESRLDWDNYVQKHPDSTVYHHRAWESVAQRAYGLKTHFLIARENTGDNQSRQNHAPVHGILPLFRKQHGFIQPHLTNGLFGAYAPVLSDFPEAHEALLKRARRILEERRLPYLCLKTLSESEPEENGRPPDFKKMDEWVIATLPIQKTPEENWNNLRNKIRNCVRKAERSGLKVRVGKDCLREFYDVVADNMHSKGAPAYGFPFISEVAQSFGNDAEVITLWLEDQIIAGALLLFHKKTAYIPFASSRPNTLHMSPNNLLYWQIIHQSCLRGMNLLDFGRSQKDSGSLQFKLGWGAEIAPQPFLIYSRNGVEPSFESKRGQADFVVHTLQRLPRGIADRIGPVICRQVAGLL